MDTLEEKIIREKLMALVREENISVQEEKTEQPKLPQGKLPSDLYYNLEVLEKNRINPAHRPITSHRPFLGPFIVFGKKVARKLLKWYLNPVCEQQTAFNNAVTPSIGRLTEYLGKTVLSVEELKEEHKADIAALFLEDNKTREGMDSLQGKMDEIKNQQTRILESMIDILVREQNEKINKLQNSYEEKLDALTERINIAVHDGESYRGELRQLKDALHVEDVLKPGFFEKTSYAQSGEDAILSYIFFVMGYKSEEITYLDLGANHAREISNTFYFHKNGGHGVLVEANPALIPELCHYRFRDVVLNKLVHSGENQEMDFYVLTGDGLSTPDKAQAEEVCRVNPNVRLKEVVKVSSIGVNEIIERYFAGRAPLFVSLDIEGEDMAVLKSIDIEKYRPLVLVIETIAYRTKLTIGIKNQEIVDYMKEKGYTEYAFTGINSIFIDERIMRELGQEG